MEEKYGKANDNDDSESSSDDGTEDEDGYLLTEDLDARMSAALQAIKNKDPRVYNTDATFFDAAEAEKAGLEAAAASKNDPKEKPIYLQDYHRERYMRGDVGADDESDDENDGPSGAPLTKTYQQEQDELKKALVDSMNAADDDSGSDEDDDEDADDVDAFIKPKASTKAAKESAAATGVHPSRAGRIKKITKVDVENADKDPATFLSNFVSSRAWVPEDETSGPGWEAFDSEEEDDGNRERAEAFETAYNLRFEDPNKSNEVLKSYSRTVVSERSVRREEKTARQRQRDQDREQQEAEKQARREERARLRKLNIEEAQEKLAKIKQAAGVAGRDLAEDEWMGLLDDAWDNEAWEAKMRKQFGDDYYAEKDASLEGELAAGGVDNDEDRKGKKNKKNLPKKPKWDDDIDIKDLIPDFEDDSAPKITLSDEENEEGEGEGGEDDEVDEDDEEGLESKRRKTGKALKKDRADAKREARRERARIEALVDRQMALDDPTALAAAGPATGVNTELSGLFRYRETSPQAFGLTSRDILLAPSDTALNEFAGLKKLATFRDEERKRKDRKKLGKKARLRQWRRDTFGADYEHSGPTFGFERFVDEEAEAAAAAAAEASGHKKRKSKHREEGGDSDADKPKKKKRSRKNKGKGKASDE